MSNKNYQLKLIKKNKVGVEFEEEGNGKSNGTIKGVSLFECPKTKGLFVRPDRVFIFLSFFL